MFDILICNNDQILLNVINIVFFRAEAFNSLAFDTDQNIGKQYVIMYNYMSDCSMFVDHTNFVVLRLFRVFS